MAWDESKHPRDDDGKFTDGLNALIMHSQGKIKKRRAFSLSKMEWRIYYKKLAELKAKYGAEYMNDDEIPPIKIDNKILLSSGTFENPTVYEVIEVHGDMFYAEDNDD